jgi:hypothetical protein
VISQLGSLLFKLARHLLAWAASPLQIRSLFCYLDMMVRPLYKKSPYEKQTKQELEEHFFYLDPRGTAFPLHPCNPSTQQSDLRSSVMVSVSTPWFLRRP